VINGTSLKLSAAGYPACYEHIKSTDLDSPQAFCTLKPLLGRGTTWWAGVEVDVCLSVVMGMLLFRAVFFFWPFFMSKSSSKHTYKKQMTRVNIVRSGFRLGAMFLVTCFQPKSDDIKLQRDVRVIPLNFILLFLSFRWRFTDRNSLLNCWIINPRVCLYNSSYILKASFFLVKCFFFEIFTYIERFSVLY